MRITMRKHIVNFVKIFVFFVFNRQCFLTTKVTKSTQRTLFYRQKIHRHIGTLRNRKSISFSTNKKYLPLIMKDILFAVYSPVNQPKMY